MLESLLVRIPSCFCFLNETTTRYEPTVLKANKNGAAGGFYKLFLRKA